VHLLIESSGYCIYNDL